MPRRKKVKEPIIWGEIHSKKDVDGITRKHFFPNSLGYQNAVLSRYSEGKKLGIQISEEELSFSDEQRDYHFVLLGFIAQYTGNTKDDEHTTAMREVFGKKMFKNYEGELEEGRYSLSNASELNLEDVQKLIDRDLRVCIFLELVIPTKEELGYVDENKLSYHK